MEEEFYLSKEAFFRYTERQQEMSENRGKAPRGREKERDMDIRDYEYIVAIAEKGGISRAAEQLFITQSALTKFLQRTEQKLGMELFVRRGKQFLLTEAGQRYVEIGRAIINLDHQLAEQLQRQFVMEKFRIRFGFSMGRTSEMIENIFPEFYKKYPEIMIYAKGETSRKLMMGLQNNEQDMVLVTNVERLPGYTYLPMGKSQLVLAVPEDSPLLQKAYEDADYPYPVIDTEYINGINMVTLPVSTNSGALTKELCERYELNVKMVLQVSDVRSLMDAVERGLGAAMFMSVPIGKKRIRYLSLKNMEIMEQTVVMVFRSDKNLSPAMKYLMFLIFRSSGLKIDNSIKELLFDNSEFE